MAKKVYGHTRETDRSTAEARGYKGQKVPKVVQEPTGSKYTVPGDSGTTKTRWGLGVIKDSVDTFRKGR